MTLRVLDPGLQTLVVDFGRPASRSLGVPVGGAADRFGLALGNALVGNSPATPALEINLAGPVLQATCDLGCVAYGAPFALTSDRQPLTAGTTFTLTPGETLRLGVTSRGMRAYLCVRGGLIVPTMLGSCSSLEPVREGMELPCPAGNVPRRFVRGPFGWNAQPRTLRVLDGPQADWFRDEVFFHRQFRVAPATNRMGLRLQGQPLSLPDRELVSEPVCPGAVQVTRDGQCIILGVDGQTIGGYPKIAQVISADLDKLAQLRPGVFIIFQRVSLDEAERLYRFKHRELDQWLTRLRETLP